MFVRLLISFPVRFKPHGVSDHGEKQQGHAAGYPLYTSERTAGGSAKHGEPEVVTGQFLADRRGEELLEGDQVFDAGNRKDPVYQAVILLTGQPAVTQEKISE